MAPVLPSTAAGFSLLGERMGLCEARACVRNVLLRISQRRMNSPGYGRVCGSVQALNPETAGDIFGRRPRSGASLSHQRQANMTIVHCCNTYHRWYGLVDVLVRDRRAPGWNKLDRDERRFRSLNARVMATASSLATISVLEQTLASDCGLERRMLADAPIAENTSLTIVAVIFGAPVLHFGAVQNYRLRPISP